MKGPLTLLLLISFACGYSQQHSVLAGRWADSVLRTLSEDQRIGQLMILRTSSINSSTKKVTFYEDAVKDAIRKYNIGGICLFQGDPLQQAAMINNLQQLAKTPLFVSIDAENGLGMRMDSVVALPRQMMMGAVNDATLIYEYGRLVGEQCKRMGIQINYGPVVDINNNPNNPVINDRAFGEDKLKVALYGMQYMRGLQDVGVMAVAKHFPGHGDVSVDSHYDLPVIKKSRSELDSLELYPFRQIVQAGVGGVMVAHLAVPALDNTANLATSLSPKAVTGLLRDELKFQGLIITDGLEMKGVSKFHSSGEVSVKALEAGNDMLCLPVDLPESIRKIKEAIRKKDLSWEDINERVRRVLIAKYEYGLSRVQPVKLENLVHDLNEKTEEMRRLIARNSITLLRNEESSIFPLPKGKRVAYIGVGLQKDNAFAQTMREEYDAHVYYFDYKMSEARIPPLLDLLSNRYDVVVLGVHNYSRYPQNGFGISRAALTLIEQVQQRYRTITLTFGNPYAIRNFCDARVLLACYEDDDITQRTAADLLVGRAAAKGRLPVTVCGTMKYGTGIVPDRVLPTARPSDLGFRARQLVGIDSIVNDAIEKKAIPGAVVLVAKDGRIAYERAYGYLGYDSSEAVYPETIYDVASVTKIMATTLAVMKLYDEGKLVLSKRLGDYLPWTRGTNKEKLTLRNVLIHQAGLKAWIPFFRETVDSMNVGGVSYQIYSASRDETYPVRVAEHMYMRRDWTDTIYRRILQSPVAPQGIYVYSDLDFIFLGKVVETITGMPLDEYVRKNFYDPLRLKSTAFKPRERFLLDKVAPTETETTFRNQLLRGDVHDPGAAMLGGVAGHAGLFSDAYDLAVLSQLLLNGGQMNGIRFFSKETVDLFTKYHGNNRRGLGFDKPDRKNSSRRDPYPTLSASPFTFGHTGFTGTCVWVDPLFNLTYIFLSNRVYSNGDPGRFNRMNVRSNVHELIYQSLLQQSPKFQIQQNQNL